MMIHNNMQSFPGDDNVCYVWHHFSIRMAACILNIKLIYKTGRRRGRETKRNRERETYICIVLSKVQTNDSDVNDTD